MHNLEIKNTALLSKWLYQLLKTDGTWQQILRNKYLGTKPLVQFIGSVGILISGAVLRRLKRIFCGSDLL